MNRVQTVTQKHYRVEKPGRKPSQVHEHPTGPACAHRQRPGRVRMAVSWAGLSVSWSGPPVVSQPSAGFRSRPAHCLSPARAAPQRPRPRATAQRLRAPRAWCAVSWAWLGCIAIQPSLAFLLPSHNTPGCIATHSVPAGSPLSQYKFLYCDSVS